MRHGNNVSKDLKQTTQTLISTCGVLSLSDLCHDNHMMVIIIMAQWSWLQDWEILSRCIEDSGEMEASAPGFKCFRSITAMSTVISISKPRKQHGSRNTCLYVLNLTCPSEYSVASTVLGARKSLFLRFLALLSLNQSLSRSLVLLSPLSVCSDSASCPVCLRRAHRSARTVEPIRNGAVSAVSII